MRTRRRRLFGLLVCLPLLGPAAPAFGFNERLEPFAQALGEAYRDIKETGRSRRHAAPERELPRLADILKTSDGVFAASPDASAKLKHLREVSRRQAAAEEPGGAPARDLFAGGEQGLASLVGISVFWHEAQHRYDHAAPYRAALSGVAMELPMPLEMERRGWEAGCAFWRAGVAAIVRPQGGDWPRAYYCDDKFPAEYYCRLYFSVEIVVLTAHELKAMGRTRAQVLAAQAPASPFEAVLRAYCGEYERAERGNPLDASGLSFQWSVGDCLERALKTTLAPAWKGSGELCRDGHSSGADIRGQARELLEW
jgi:hypothetical protein